MDWLREYAIPLVVTIVLHFALMAWLAVDFVSTPDLPKVAPPDFIKASIVKMKQEQKKPPKKDPKPPKKEPETKKDDSAQKEKERQAQLAKEKKEREAAEKKRKAEEARKKKEQEELRKKKEREEELRKQREREEQERLAQEAKDDRADDLLAMMEEEEEEQLQASSAEDEQIAMSYAAYVRELIASRWDRPPSARNDMTCELAIELLPNGQVVSVRILVSSGNDAFDRSTVAAVKKVDRFDRLSELESHIFEKYYRNLQIEFTPGDLRL